MCCWPQSVRSWMSDPLGSLLLLQNPTESYLENRRTEYRLSVGLFYDRERTRLKSVL